MIRRVALTDFKRFTKLTLTVPGNPRLVVLCGPNGSGKSSFFEGLKKWQDLRAGWGYQPDPEYLRKGGVPTGPALDASQADVEFSYGAALDPEQVKKALYVRTAYRHEAEFTLNAIQRSPSVLDGPRPPRMIDGDVRVSDNYQRLVGSTFDLLFSGAGAEMSGAEIREQLIGRVREALEAVLPGLTLEGLSDPLSGGTFRFRKGMVSGFPYKNLSGGEKAVFDLLLDLAVKQATYGDAVVCIDEPEVHANPRVHGLLLDALLSFVGDAGQLWLATHSIGMLQRAQELQLGSPSDVAFFDFDQDFDQAVGLEPISVSRSFWKATLAESLGDVAGLVAPARVVLCEGQPSSGRRANFDARCLDAIFAPHIPDTDFLSVGNDLEVASDEMGVGRAVQTLVRGTTVIRLIDRDDRSEAEEELARSEGVRVLSRRHLEAFLLDDEVLGALCREVAQPEKWPEVQAAKREAHRVSQAGGKAADDWKAPRGDIYNACKRILRLERPGSNADVFLQQRLAPLITPHMQVYRELHESVFGS